MDALDVRQAAVTARFAVRGMTCGSCVRHVEAALAAVPGVRAASVDGAGAAAVVQYDPAVCSTGDLQEAVGAAGYALALPTPERRVRWPLRPVGFGLLAVLGLLAFYLGVIAIAQGWAHALEQLAEDRWFIGAIATGFGAQVALFTYLRQLHAQAAVGGVAVSTGTSTTAMLACCAHHLTDVLPVLGVSGAAIFLDVYKTPLLWLGIIMNVVGIVYMLRKIRQARGMACHTPAS